MLRGPRDDYTERLPLPASRDPLDVRIQEERETIPLRNSGRGPTSSKAALRLFDAPDGYQPRITLFRDSAAWCPCEYLQECSSRLASMVPKGKGMMLMGC
jgi:hypothetical protein